MGKGRATSKDMEMIMVTMLRQWESWDNHSDVDRYDECEPGDGRRSEDGPSAGITRGENSWGLIEIIV